MCCLSDIQNYLENSMDCIVHRVAKSDTTEQLSLSFFYFHRLNLTIVSSRKSRQPKVVEDIVKG